MILASLIMAAVGLPMIFAGQLAGWAATGLFLLCAAVLVAMPRFRARQTALPRDLLAIDDTGIRRILGDGRGEALAWADLSEVMILTTADGPFAEDVFFVLRGAGEAGVMVGQGLAVEHHLLEELQRRLPDLDNEAVIRAMGSTQEARFVVWPPQPYATTEEAPATA
ncbi:MAG TPA: hypothetical protein VGN52_04360 [Burkholderiales bacterium]